LEPCSQARHWPWKRVRQMRDLEGSALNVRFSVIRSPHRQLRCYEAILTNTQSPNSTSSLLPPQTPSHASPIPASRFLSLESTMTTVTVLTAQTSRAQQLARTLVPIRRSSPVLTAQIPLLLCRASIARTKAISRRICVSKASMTAVAITISAATAPMSSRA
jgi:hypothetical protein